MGRIYLILLGVMAIWGFNLSALAILVSFVTPVTLTAFRILTAGVAVLIITYFLGIFRLPTKKELGTIILITLFNVVLHHSLLAIGLTKTSGVNAGIILGSSPLVTMVLSLIFLGDRLSRIRVLGFILGFIGVFITSVGGSEALNAVSQGDFIIFASMFVQAISFILISKLNPSFDPRLLTGYMLLIGSLFIFLLAYLMENDFSQITTVLFSPKLLLIFLFSAILATALGHMIYNFAVKNVGPAETALFINLNTFFALLGAYLFLGESIYRNHYIGLLFIVLGVFLGSGSLEYLIKKRKNSSN